MAIETKNETSREITSVADLLDGLANKASQDEELPLALVEAYCRQAAKLLRRLNSSIVMNMEHQQRMFDALKRISKDYMTTDEIERDADNEGLDVDEYLKMAYENIQADAKAAIAGLRRPA